MKRIKSRAKLFKLGFSVYWVMFACVFSLQAGERESPTPKIIWLIPASLRLPENICRELKRPNAVEIDAQGNIYIADTGNNRLLKLDSKLNLKSATSGWGEERDLLDTPMDLTLDSGLNLFAADYMNGRIVRFDIKLNYLWNVILPTLNPDWEYPAALALSDWGELYILEESSQSIVKLQITMSSASAFEGFRPGKLNLNGVKRIASDDKGLLYLADAQADKIAVFDRYGNFMRELSSPVHCQAVDCDGSFIWIGGDMKIACYEDFEPVKTVFTADELTNMQLVDLAVCNGKLVVLAAGRPYITVYHISRSPARVEW